MGSILAPAPPASAYNPNRRVSDLILSQVKHFQHVENKHGKLGIDPKLALNIHTEGGAAAYIAAVTKALGGKTLANGTAKEPTKKSRTARTHKTAAPMKKATSKGSSSKKSSQKPGSSKR